MNIVIKFPLDLSAIKERKNRKLKMKDFWNTMFFGLSGV